MGAEGAVGAAAGAVTETAVGEDEDEDMAVIEIVVIRKKTTTRFLILREKLDSTVELSSE